MEMVWILGLFFIFCTFVFFLIVAFFPEWVGITGKKAHEVNEQQSEEKNQDPK